jgi:hypothetical protein
MEFERNYFFIISLLGILLLLTYYNHAMSAPDNVDVLWGRIRGNLRIFYYISILFTAACFLYILHYLYITLSLDYNKSLQLLFTISAIIVLSMFWMPFSLKNVVYQLPRYKIIIISILLAVSIASLLLAYELFTIQEKKYKMQKNIAFIAAIYFFFHTFVMDTIIWSMNFF